MEDNAPRKPGRPRKSKDDVCRNVAKKKKQKEETPNMLQTSRTKDVATKFLIEDALKTHKKLKTSKSKPSIQLMRDNVENMQKVAFLAYSTQLNEYHTIQNAAIEALEEVERTGKVSGVAVKETVKQTRIRNLKETINKAYRIDSRLTTLRGEITKALAEIDRIESGRVENQTTIYQIISGKGDPEENAKLDDILYTLPKEDYDVEDFIDGEIKEDSNE